MLITPEREIYLGYLDAHTVHKVETGVVFGCGVTGAYRHVFRTGDLFYPEDLQPTIITLEVASGTARLGTPDIPEGDVGRVLAESYVRQLQKSWREQNFVERALPYRLMRLLKLLADVNNTVFVTHYRLATLLGAERTSVTKHLKLLEEQGLIWSMRNEIHLSAGGTQGAPHAPGETDKVNV